MKSKEIISRILSFCLTLVMLIAEIPVSHAEGKKLGVNTDSKIFAAIGNEPDRSLIEKAYRDVITAYYYADIDDLSPAHYALTDIDKDGILELLIGMRGVSYSVTSVYTYTDNEVKLIGEIEEGHGSFYAIDDRNGLLECYEAQGHIKITIWRKIIIWGSEEEYTLIPETVYDEDFYGDSYPSPNEFVPNVSSLPYYKCNDLSGISKERFSDGKNGSVSIADAKVGDYIVLGSYEQDNDSTNGKEGIEWLVLAKEADKVLVISRYGIDCRRFNSSRVSVTWDKCSIRKWLNSSFLNAAFTEQEKAMISSVTVRADKNPEYSVKAGNSTKDKIFLLSVTEADQYFSTDKMRKCVPTAYAFAQGIWTDDISMIDGTETCRWWLRSTGRNSMRAAGTDFDGSVSCFGYYVNSSTIAIRPAMWIDLA